MNAQNSTPINESSPKRAPRPRSLAIARARAVNHLGRSRRASAGSGRVAAAVAAVASGIQHLDQLARGVLAGEAEEDLLQPLDPRRGAGPQLFHRAARANRSLRDDRDAIAQRLRDFEGVGAHHDRVAAARVLAEQILENLRRLRVEPDHRLVDDDDFGTVYERTRD